MDNSHLTACLILYRQRRDEALGLNWTSAAVRGLLWFYGKQQQLTTDKLLTIAYLNGIINRGADEIKRLVNQAETSQDKLQILKIVTELKIRIEKASQLLNKLIAQLE